MSMISQHRIQRAIDGNMIIEEDLLAIEEPLEIILQTGNAGREKQSSVAVTMRTPGHDKELAVGFLFTEGILKSEGDIKMIIEEASGINTVLIILKDGASATLPALRNFYTTSSCGVCGKASMEAIRTISMYPPGEDDIILHPDVFYQLDRSLHEKQVVFESTGGIHASMLLNLTGHFISLREDVGRHNALDKLIGDAFLNHQLPLSRHILFLSGRASFELVQKAHMAGIKIVASVGAPSSLAVSFAEDRNMTLAGFLRSNRFNIYSGFQRIG